METNLAGPGSEARVTGGYAGGPGQHLDYDTTQEHAAPNTNSDLAFRGVLAAGATAVWRGMIRVDPGAQQTDAFQESRNLLLSPEAHADAIPGLEIEADDVRCTHAAAIAQIDRDQLFYLTSRGLDSAEAKSLIIEGFLESLVERLPEGPVREEISAALERRLARFSSADSVRVVRPACCGSPRTPRSQPAVGKGPRANVPRGQAAPLRPSVEPISEHHAFRHLLRFASGGGGNAPDQRRSQRIRS